MSNTYQHQDRYNQARTHFLANPEMLIELEKFLTNYIVSIINDHLIEIKEDYNSASDFYPYWQSCPPQDRGRKPIQDQHPWSEVGEKVLGSKLSRLLDLKFSVRDSGFPIGSDQRFVLTNKYEDEEISAATGGITNSVWLFVDIKSAGPTDNEPSLVMSPNQVSGDGIWKNTPDGVKNSVFRAIGTRTEHEFHVTLPPIIVFPDGTIVPIVTIALKPKYQVLPPLVVGTRNAGQPLDEIDIACIPNGLLITAQTLKGLDTYKGLFHPGKDGNSSSGKVRARVCLEGLKKIAPWRMQTIKVPYP